MSRKYSYVRRHRTGRHRTSRRTGRHRTNRRRTGRRRTGRRRTIRHRTSRRYKSVGGSYEVEPYITVDHYQDDLAQGAYNNLKKDFEDKGFTVKYPGSLRGYHPGYRVAPRVVYYLIIIDFGKEKVVVYDRYSGLRSKHVGDHLDDFPRKKINPTPTTRANALQKFYKNFNVFELGKK